MSYIKAYNELFDKVKKNSDYDLEKIEKSFILAREAHTGQYRKSGEEYIIHPIEVSSILVDLKMDTDTIVAGLLHDVVEDTLISLADIEYEFGRDVAELVDGVTKLKNLPSASGKKIENVRKMVISMSRDIRVVIIKLADRLHNMRTIEFQSREKQIEKSRECLDIFAPIAHRIGMSKIKSELEDISFKYLKPEEYQEIKKLVNTKKETRDRETKKIIEEIEKDLLKYNIKASVNGRPKHLYSIYRKIVEKQKKFNDIMDLIAIRVLVEKEEECYMVLGLVHSLFTPVQGRFKDYIAVPKPNGYQSIHTTIEYNKEKKVEIQIRTKKMHEIAEDGVAAHWKYKEKKSKDKNEEYYKAVKKTYEQKEDITKKMTNIVFDSTIFVFTPKGDVVELETNSTALDFAFQVHTQIGYRTIGAKVNDVMVPLDYVLKNADKVEILTSKKTNGPGKDWSKMVNNNSSKIKIRKWFKDKEFEDKVKLGETLVEEEFSKIGLKFKELEDDNKVHLYMKKYNINDLKNLYYRFATKDLNIQSFLDKFKEEKVVNEEEILDTALEKGNKQITYNNNKSGVKISGADNTLYHFAKCCSPLPGSNIKGYVTRGRGIVIHRDTCKNLENLLDTEKEREVYVYWDEKILEKSDAKYPYSFKIVATDRDRLLLDYVNIINEYKLDIISMNTTLKKKNSQVLSLFNIRIMIKDKEAFEKLKKSLLNVKGTIEILQD
ncbi:RelA/SpoT family protein [Oceanivirga miroungae]|uniref:Putative GTP pyrophosphokinase RelA (ATP:GTP 3'-pyrophosphotransferase) (PPGPP synthetase I) ((P)PPGPP synthetase) (GTP diphosphokinase) n=1 Tax=Oceanivirga miroungae TaxID=1130046 RepID=A0A6I8MDU5_9FUSO|nr:bifunctional (p)ppGpp synthetase/guanosine-3',5'-bis(diphosphate) 3'-pyrophosphohydrolase [Oceanivirga miroungae]VWL85697.1 putative GTP pyrophosphokinase RelA (ATP:GTP 3'-pyrophosphotransferase) (PPGPP synthetase I) ((P)PPGPP synthetase) (GTP diphosphokinase) [Oceanivirga miroungae]